MVHSATVAEQAIQLYNSCMTNFIRNSPKIPNGMELRQAHARFKLTALDYLRINSVGECRSWKLELELDRSLHQLNQLRRQLLQHRQGKEY